MVGAFYRGFQTLTLFKGNKLLREVRTCDSHISSK